MKSRISIHALLAESDYRRTSESYKDRHFYPRSPCGERPLAPEENPTEKAISIHALLAESDSFGLCEGVLLLRISIHALLAESDVRVVEPGLVNKLFLSTLSLRRATTAQ